MQISALTDIVEGKLLNSPSISFITQTHTNIKKVNEGDAFFAQNEVEIKEAIIKGAFAIIIDFSSTITDNEIAWIKVDSFSKAVSNVLRYKLLEHKNKFIKTNKIFFNLLNIFKTKELSDVILLQNNLIKDFEVLNTLESEKLIFGTNLQLLNSISGDVMILENKQFSIQNLTSHSLFETSFSHKETFFDKIKLPTVYINDLLQQLELFEYKLDLKKLNNFNLFKPVFVNKSKQIVPYGQTNRFILASPDDDIADIEINYLRKHYSYGNIQILDTNYLSDDEIFQKIKQLDFNALYCKSSTIDNIISILEQNHKIDTLTI
jgi:ferrochelatase